MILLLVVLFAIFLLSKWYSLCERNREINIQTIVEEHYKRYMDQEEEYGREKVANPSQILTLCTLTMTLTLIRI